MIGTSSRCVCSQAALTLICLKSKFKRWVNIKVYSPKGRALAVESIERAHKPLSHISTKLRARPRAHKGGRGLPPKARDPKPPRMPPSTHPHRTQPPTHAMSVRLVRQSGAGRSRLVDKQRVTGAGRTARPGRDPRTPDTASGTTLSDPLGRARGLPCRRGQRAIGAHEA